MTYYRNSKFKAGYEPTQADKANLEHYNNLMMNPPLVLFASNEELDRYYDQVLRMESALKDKIIDEY